MNDTITRVRLLTNEVEMATQEEAFLRRVHPVRPYNLLAHEFPGYVRTVNLGPPLSVINLTNDLEPTHELPLTGPHDARWAWKLTELERLQHLQPSLSEILGE